MMLKDKVAIVTGAARGIGRAHALRLARSGAHVAVVDLDLRGASKFGETLAAPSVSQEIRDLNRRSIDIEVDLSKRDQVKIMVDRVGAEFGRIDILVNNAGGALTPVERSGPSQATDADIEATLSANFLSTVACCQEVVPIMKRQGGGAIVNTSSFGASMVMPNMSYALYGCAKAAIEHYTRNLAAECGPFRIRVNAIAPGHVMTARVRAQAEARGLGTDSQVQRIPLRRAAEPDECAKVVEFLASDLASYVTGQIISVCGGASLPIFGG